LGNIGPRPLLKHQCGKKTGKTLTFNSIVYKRSARFPADASENANQAKEGPRADNCGALIRSELS